MHKIKDYADCDVIPIEVTVGKGAGATPVLFDFEERLDMVEELGDSKIPSPVSDK